MLPTITLLQVLLSVFSGFLVGFSLGLIGGGGSILAVPLLLYLVGYSRYPHLVIGTTALAVGINAYINVYQHMRHRTVNVGKGVTFAAFGAVGALGGAELGLITPGRTLLFFFAILMIVVAALMLRGNRQDAKPSKSGVTTTQPKARRKGGTLLGLTGLATGVASGYFGIGGGFLIVPGLMFSAALPITEAISTSLISVGTFGVVSAIRYALAGEVYYPIALLYVLGGTLGGYFGTKLEHSVPRSTLRKAFAIIVVTVAIYIMVQNPPHI
ncbi:MAG: sulfite exporter TauE/SafE family protein [Thermoprotei archaeon]